MKYGVIIIGIILSVMLGANSTATASTNYFTEYFWGDFDLGGLAITFEPSGGSNYYEVTEAIPITELPAGKPADKVINFQYDWHPVSVPVATGKTIPFYGVSYSSFYVSPNGYISMGSPNYASYPSTTEHFSLPQISTYFSDLDSRHRRRHGHGLRTF